MRVFSTLLASLLIAPAAFAGPATRPFYRGCDISMLPEIEAGGGTFRDASGAKADAVHVLRDHGVNLFRVRLFVEPSKDFNKVWGATQDLAQVLPLCKRIKATGAALLLDLHYSDTWADGLKQQKPKVWEGQSVAALERTVHEYTAHVLAELAKAGAPPDLVQIGNEIAGGMIWPEGKVLDATPDIAGRQWATLARFLDAGARAVREASTPQHKIDVMVHIHGGGRPGLSQHFFAKLQEHRVDYDVIGLSVYPAWGDSIEELTTNLQELARRIGKPVLLAETGYPWKPEADVKSSSLMRWPQTPDGQRAFVQDLTALLRNAPGGEGFVWWYPEAISSDGRFLWRDGAEALFDPTGKPLPAMSAFEEPR